MKLQRFYLLALIVTVACNSASARAQMPLPMNQPPPSPSFNVPPPPAPPPPRIEVPVVPQLDAPPRAPAANVAPRKSFGKRVDDCLSDSTAARLGPNERAEYSRGCANR